VTAQDESIPANDVRVSINSKMDVRIRMRQCDNDRSQCKYFYNMMDVVLELDPI